MWCQSMLNRLGRCELGVKSVIISLSSGSFARAALVLFVISRSCIAKRNYGVLEFIYLSNFITDRLPIKICFYHSGKLSVTVNVWLRRKICSINVTRVQSKRYEVETLVLINMVITPGTIWLVIKV